MFADGGFAGRLLDWASEILRTTLEIVRKPADQRGFAVIPRRWAVERTLAWLTAHRRLARDYERDPATSEAMIRWAAINTITRRIARGGTRHPPTAAHIPDQSVDLLKHALSLIFNLCAVVVAVMVRSRLTVLPTSWRVRGLPVAGAGWASGAGSAGFRCAGREQGGRAEVPKPAADPGRGEPARSRRVVPRGGAGRRRGGGPGAVGCARR